MINKNETWKIVNEDCIEHMATLPENVFDFSVFSPPLPNTKRNYLEKQMV